MRYFGGKNERELKKLRPTVEKINVLEPEIQAMSDERLKAQTGKFKARIENGEKLLKQSRLPWACFRTIIKHTIQMSYVKSLLVFTKRI